jgi:hypothetical protein
MNSLSTFHYSFYLYNILKEPIPFEIQCKILNHSPHHQNNCSSLTLIDNDHLILNKHEKKDSSYIIFRSSSVDVTRQLPLKFFEQIKSPISSNGFSSNRIIPNYLCLDSFAPIIAVHHIECFLFAFSLFIHWIL